MSHGEEVRTLRLSEPIQIWRFSYAPEWLQRLSSHGGDEDWVALVPAALADYPWDKNFMFRSGGPFGCCDVSRHEVEGYVVYIGAHA